MKYLAIIMYFLSSISIGANNVNENRDIFEQKSTNQRVFQLLSESGAVEGKAYNFDQIFTSTSFDNLKKLRKELESYGYIADNIDRNDDGHYYLDAYQEIKYDSKTLEQHSLIMLELANKYGAYYDGWGVELR